MVSRQNQTLPVQLWADVWAGLYGTKEKKPKDTLNNSD